MSTAVFSAARIAEILAPEGSAPLLPTPEQRAVLRKAAPLLEHLAHLD